MNSLGVAKIDGGCHVILSGPSGDIIEEKENFSCSQCGYNNCKANCVFEILRNFTKPIEEKYLKHSNDVSYEFYQSHPDMFK